MTNFSINRNQKQNHNQPTINKNFIGKKNILTSKIVSPNTIEPVIIDNTKENNKFDIPVPQNGIKVRSKQLFLPKSVNNYAKIITIRKDTLPIRNNLYHYYKNEIIDPIEVDKFYFCNEQKISSIFSTSGDTHWFSTLIDKQPSYKTSLFGKVVFERLSLLKDCSCNYFDFSGSYSIDRFSENNDNQLIYSSNKRVSKATIDFDAESNYIIITIYSEKVQSYVKIRLRPPVRYRPLYNDWVFDENVTIENILSSTEFAELINCCNITNETLNNDR